MRLRRADPESTKWKDELDRWLSRGDRVFLLVSGFEKGSCEGRQQLGSVLRALSERHGQALWVVLCGGERLASLKYEEGGLSVLNAAERIDWPEPLVEDVLVWQARYFPGLELGREAAKEVLNLCGGHPRLVRHCLERRHGHGLELRLRAEGRSDREILIDYGAVWRLFTIHERDFEAKRRICGWLAQDELGSVRPWLGDRLLRSLYWSNALVSRAKMLSWRCEVIRDVGRRVLECG